MMTTNERLVIAGIAIGIGILSMLKIAYVFMAHGPADVLSCAIPFLFLAFGFGMLSGTADIWNSIHGKGTADPLAGSPACERLP